jgi:hypothetical protein
VLLATCLGAAGLAGCGPARDGPAPLAGDLTLQQARAFDEFPLVYAGDSADGLPLTAILRRKDDTADYVSFVYGDCLPISADGGCAPPAEIQVWPATLRNRSSHGGSRGPPAPEGTNIRGSPAAFFDAGTRLELYGDRTTVVVFAHSRERVRAIADALRCVAGRESGERASTLDC